MPDTSNINSVVHQLLADTPTYSTGYLRRLQRMHISQKAQKGALRAALQTGVFQAVSIVSDNPDAIDRETARLLSERLAKLMRTDIPALSIAAVKAAVGVQKGLVAEMISENIIEDMEKGVWDHSPYVEHLPASVAVLMDQARDGKLPPSLTDATIESILNRDKHDYWSRQLRWKVAVLVNIEKPISEIANVYRELLSTIPEDCQDEVFCLAISKRLLKWGKATPEVIEVIVRNIRYDRDPDPDLLEILKQGFENGQIPASVTRRIVEVMVRMKMFGHSGKDDATDIISRAISREQLVSDVARTAAETMIAIPETEGVIDYDVSSYILGEIVAADKAHQEVYHVLREQLTSDNHTVRRCISRVFRCLEGVGVVSPQLLPLIESTMALGDQTLRESAGKVVRSAVLANRIAPNADLGALWKVIKATLEQPDRMWRLYPNFYPDLVKHGADIFIHLADSRGCNLALPAELDIASEDVKKAFAHAVAHRVVNAMMDGGAARNIAKSVSANPKAFNNPEQSIVTNALLDYFERLPFGYQLAFNEPTHLISDDGTGSHEERGHLAFDPVLPDPTEVDRLLLALDNENADKVRILETLGQTAAAGYVTESMMAVFKNTYESGGRTLAARAIWALGQAYAHPQHQELIRSVLINAFVSRADNLDSYFDTPIYEESARAISENGIVTDEVLKAFAKYVSYDSLSVCETALRAIGILAETFSLPLNFWEKVVKRMHQVDDDEFAPFIECYGKALQNRACSTDAKALLVTALLKIMGRSEFGFSSFDAYREVIGNAFTRGHILPSVEAYEALEVVIRRDTQDKEWPEAVQVLGDIISSSCAAPELFKVLLSFVDAAREGDIGYNPMIGKSIRSLAYVEHLALSRSVIEILREILQKRLSEDSLFSLKFQADAAFAIAIIAFRDPDLTDELVTLLVQMDAAYWARSNGSHLSEWYNAREDDNLKFALVKAFGYLQDSSLRAKEALINMLKRTGDKRFIYTTSMPAYAAEELGHGITTPEVVTALLTALNASDLSLRSASWRALSTLPGI